MYRMSIFVALIFIIIIDVTVAQCTARGGASCCTGASTCSSNGAQFGNTWYCCANDATMNLNLPSCTCDGGNGGASPTTSSPTPSKAPATCSATGGASCCTGQSTCSNTFAFSTNDQLYCCAATATVNFVLTTDCTCTTSGASISLPGDSNNTELMWQLRSYILPSVNYLCGICAYIGIVTLGTTSYVKSTSYDIRRPNLSSFSIGTAPSTLQDCAKLCNSFSNCIAFVVSKDFSICGMKSVIDNVGTDSNYDVYKKNGYYVGKSPTPVAGYTQKLNTYYSSKIQLFTSTDSSASPSICFNSCNSNSACVGVLTASDGTSCSTFSKIDVGTSMSDTRYQAYLRIVSPATAGPTTVSPATIPPTTAAATTSKSSGSTIVPITGTVASYSQSADCTGVVSSSSFTSGACSGGTGGVVVTCLADKSWTINFYSSVTCSGAATRQLAASASACVASTDNGQTTSIRVTCANSQANSVVSNNDSSSGQSSSIIIIAAAVGGAIVVIAVIILVVYCMRSKNAAKGNNGSGMTMSTTLKTTQLPDERNRSMFVANPLSSV